MENQETQRLQSSRGVVRLREIPALMPAAPASIPEDGNVPG